jgi:hypothetical protein
MPGLSLLSVESERTLCCLAVMQDTTSWLHSPNRGSVRLNLEAEERLVDAD